MAVVLFIFAQQVAILIKAPDMTTALRMTAVIVVINAVNTAQIGMMSGLKQFRQIAINNTYSGILTFITSTVFTYFWGLDGALISLLVSMLFNAVINNISIHRVSDSLGDCRSSWRIRIKLTPSIRT